MWCRKIFCSKSTGKGNYSKDLKYAGYSEDYKVNNIYDLAGNAYEWTMKASSGKRVIRGGNCNLNGEDYPASYRNGYSITDEYEFLGFRVALYINI